MSESFRLVAPDGAIADAIVFRDALDLTAAAADLVTERANKAISARGRFTIALSGGNTPKPVYARLASAKLDWSHVHIYFGDERCVPPNDPLSNYRMAKETLLDRVAIPPANVRRMRGEDPPDAAARQYEQTLSRRASARTGGSISSCSASATTAIPRQSFRVSPPSPRRAGASLRPMSRWSACGV